MMADYDTQTSSQNQTLDEICYAYYGTTLGVVEQVLACNVGLAEYGPHLPIGITIKMPAINKPATPNTVKLWE